MKFDPKNGLLELSGVEFRTRPVLFQNRLWQSTEPFFKQVELEAVQRYNESHGTNKSILPISFVYVISKGGHRVQTSVLLEMLGYDGDKFSPADDDYKFLLNEMFVRYTKSSPEDCFVQSFRLPDAKLLSVVNFLILPYEDFFIGIASVEV